MDNSYKHYCISSDNLARKFGLFAAIQLPQVIDAKWTKNDCKHYAAMILSELVLTWQRRWLTLYCSERVLPTMKATSAERSLKTFPNTASQRIEQKRK